LGSFTFFLSWTGGVIFALLAVGWFRNEGIDWANMFGMFLGGLIGTVIAVYLRRAAQKEE
jgi:hypothetical protein